MSDNPLSQTSLLPEKKREVPMDHIPKCGAKSKRTGKPCPQPAMANGRCRFHGGKTPKNVQSPHFQGKGQRYADVLPDSLANIYRGALNDPDLLSLTEEVALVQTRLHQLLGRIDAQESSGRWKKAQQAHKELMQASARKDDVGWRMAMDDLSHILRDGSHDYLVWEDIHKTLRQLQTLSGQEQKRRLEMNALISADQAVAFAAEVLYAVKENVSNPDERMAIHKAVKDALEKRPHIRTSVAEQATVEDDT